MALGEAGCLVGGFWWSGREAYGGFVGLHGGSVRLMEAFVGGARVLSNLMMRLFREREACWGV